MASPTPMRDTLTIAATRFKATCLEVFRALETRKLRRVIVTRRGKPVAELIPPSTEPPDLWGALRGSVSVAPGVDLARPIAEESWDADEGRLHR